MAKTDVTGAARKETVPLPHYLAFGPSLGGTEENPSYAIDQKVSVVPKTATCTCFVPQFERQFQTDR